MITENGHKLPDFIIIGAMKSGTSALHDILNRHENIFIPEKEVYFFDVDDVLQHADFFVKTRKGWTVHDFDKDFEKYFKWYTRFFEEAPDDAVIGEDTTTYLASEAAAGRIQRVLPGVKLIALLRDPVSRAYSHYWHNVAAGRIGESFENHLRNNGRNTIERGCYKRQLERYRPFLEEGRLKVVLFEAFLANQQETVDEVCRYLGLSGSVELSTFDTRKNAATVPLSIPLRLLANRIYTTFASNTSLRNIPNMPGFKDVVPKRSNDHPLVKVWDFYRQKLPSRKYPKMNPDTKSYLETLYRRLNSGLSTLISQDVSRYWPYMK